MSKYRPIRTALFSGLFVAFMTGNAISEDLLPPDWRGGPLTTYQQWDFSSGPGGGAPDVLPYFNPYGIPALFTAGSPMWLPQYSPLPGMPGREHVWHLETASTLLVNDKNQDNRDEYSFRRNLFDPCKKPEISITYFGADPEVNIVPVPGHGDFASSLDSVIRIPLPDGWTYARYDFTLYAPIHPSEEDFIIASPVGGETWIDGIVIDTQVLVQQSCFGDLDGSGAVDGGDVGLMLLDYGPCPGCSSDLDGSGEVDGADVGLMLLNFGDCPVVVS